MVLKFSLRALPTTTYYLRLVKKENGYTFTELTPDQTNDWQKDIIIKNDKTSQARKARLFIDCSVFNSGIMDHHYLPRSEPVCPSPMTWYGISSPTPQPFPFVCRSLLADRNEYATCYVGLAV